MPTSPFTPSALGARIGSGLLSFPVTHFTADDLAFDEPAYRAAVERLSRYEVGGLFAAGGTGEFFSLTAAETERVVTAAAQTSTELHRATDAVRPLAAVVRSARSAAVAEILHSAWRT